MAKRPSFQFYPSDWLRDMALRSCSIAARGLWIDMLSFMHEGSEYGFLKVGKRIITPELLANMTGVSRGGIGGLLEELQEADVFSVDERGCIFSRRMVRDEELRNKRAEGGVKGGFHGVKGAEHGKKGGRPKKETQETGVIIPPIDNKTRGVNKPPLEPPPSSSSSNSIIYISKEAKDFFRIGINLFEQKPSEYLDQKLRMTVDKFMMTIFRGGDLEAIYSRLDEEYYGYEFESENHLRNTFKSVAERVMKDQAKAKANPGTENKKGFVLGQKPRGAVNHG